MNEIEIIRPSWPSPKSVEAISTTRTGGFSVAPFNSLNLADHVGDTTDVVNRNRELVAGLFAKGAKGQWLQQVHSNRVARVESSVEPLEADALVTSNRGIVLNSPPIACHYYCARRMEMRLRPFIAAGEVWRQALLPTHWPPWTVIPINCWHG